MISQELYDETLLENEEVFELSPEEAVKETVEQLTRQCSNNNSSNDNNGISCKDIIVTEHPSTEYGTLERKRRFTFQQFFTQQLPQTCPKELQTYFQPKNNNDTTHDSKIFLYIVHQNNGMALLQQCWSNNNNNDDDYDVNQKIALQTIIEIYRAMERIHHNPQFVSLRRTFQNAFYCYKLWNQWCNKIIIRKNKNDDDDNDLILLLQLATYLCRRCENNKVAFVKHGNIIHILDTLIQQQSLSTSSKQRQVSIQACQLVTILCRYDDSTADSSCAHDVSMEFYKRATVLPIIQLTTQTFVNDSAVLCTVLAALRSLAIHDDIVQSMVACGILQLLEKTFVNQQQQTKTTTDDTDTNDHHVLLLTNILGLMRNLCANDEIKGTFCQNTTIVKGIVAIMELHYKDQKHYLLAEHGCGTMAAMALRKPQNARVLLSYEAPRVILLAMKQFPSQVTVQRQACLAIRNIVSRLTEEEKKIFLEQDAEEILRSFAGKHQGSVDEAYAALRDLGCQVGMVKLQQDGTITQRTVMFGDVKPNFRAEYDDNKGDTKNTMEQRIAKHVASLGI